MKNNNSKCCIVIPVYKNQLNEYEILSLTQCCKILSNYHIIFVTHKNLDCSEYNNICQANNISYSYYYFKEKYFFNISGYNALLLSKYFYKKFINYNYILIYQLDSYVFRDELDYWCDKSFSYIGAPWLKLNKDNTLPEFADPPSFGNGGFSLRNVNEFIKNHTFKINFIIIFHLFHSFYNSLINKSKKNNFPKYFIRFFLYLFRYIILHFNFGSNNEDEVWANIFYRKGKLPPLPEAIKFSFEQYPEFLYQLNEAKLPFGCHNCFSYYNYSFLKDKMEDN